MSIEFSQSNTRVNLMRAFAGESQARNRYTFAQGQTKTQCLFVVSALFKFTANQEKEHAEIFYNHLKDCSGETIHIEGGYPIDISKDAAKLLRMAAHNENEEHDVVYADFAKVAREEGFSKIAQDFENIAKVEKTHAQRFECFAELLENNKLFISDAAVKWQCLNCGFMLEGTQAPEICPVCNHDRGYFIRLEMSPWKTNN